MKVDYSYWQIFYDPDIPLADRVGWAALAPIAIPLSLAGCSSQPQFGNAVFIPSGNDAGSSDIASPQDGQTQDNPTPDVLSADSFVGHDVFIGPDGDTPDAISTSDTPIDVPPPSQYCAPQTVLPSTCAIVDITASETGTSVVLKDGSVLFWGRLATLTGSGYKDLVYSVSPKKLAGFQNITHISARSQHLCGSDAFGNAWCAGQNAWGQLGDGSKADSAVAVKVQGLTNVMAVSVGFFHSLALDTSGKVYAWGYNGQGQLGIADPNDPNKPIPSVVTQPTALIFSQNSPVTSIGSGHLHSFAVQQSGAAYLWGDNVAHELGLPTPDKAVYGPTFFDKGLLRLSGGERFTCYLSTGCGILCKGDGAPTNDATKSINSVSNIISGGGNFVAITQSGDAYVWGENASGQTGLGSTEAKISIPQPITGLGKIAMAAIGAGSCYDSKIYEGKDCTHICVVTAGCEVYCAGGNQSGQLGIGSASEKPSMTWVKVTGLP